MPTIRIGKPQSQQQTSVADEPIEEDPIWQALVGCQITMPLRGFLNLVPPFKELVAAMVRKEEWPITPINFAQSNEGSTILDAQSPAVKVIIKGKEVPNSIIDGGSRVNVIIKATCDRLGSNNGRSAHLSFGWPMQAPSDP